MDAIVQALSGVMMTAGEPGEGPYQFTQENKSKALHLHKNTIADIEFNQNGNWLLTASRDQLLKIIERGKLKLDPERHTCIWDNKPVTLTVTEFLILQALAQRPQLAAVVGQFGDIAIGPGGEVVVTYQSNTAIFTNTGLA